MRGFMTATSAPTHDAHGRPNGDTPLPEFHELLKLAAIVRAPEEQPYGRVVETAEGPDLAPGRRIDQAGLNEGDLNLALGIYDEARIFQRALSLPDLQRDPARREEFPVRLSESAIGGARRARGKDNTARRRRVGKQHNANERDRQGDQKIAMLKDQLEVADKLLPRCLHKRLKLPWNSRSPFQQGALLRCASHLHLVEASFAASSLRHSRSPWEIRKKRVAAIMK